MNYTDFLDCLKDANLSPLTIMDYGNTYRRFFSTHDALTEATVREFLKPHVPSTKSKYRKQLKALADFYGINIDWKRKVPHPKQVDEAPLTLSETHERRLLDWITDRNRFYAKLLTFMLETGLRVGELRNLGPEDVLQFPKPTGAAYHCIQINKENGSSHSAQGRYVPLTITARHIIAEFGLPFKFDQRRLNDVLINAREALKLPHYKIHTMRKTFYSRALRRGVDPMALMNIMGHKNISTGRVYADREAVTLCEAFEAA